VVILANDVLVNSETINRLITYMSKNPRVAVSGPIHFDLLINKRLNKGLLINPFTSLLANKVPLYIKSSINHFHICFIVSSDVFHKVNGFNYVLYPMIFEEPDLGERILSLNYHIRPCVGAKIWHPIELTRVKQQEVNFREREDRLYNSLPKAYLFFRNRIIYMRLHSSIIGFILFYFLFNPIIFFYYLTKIRIDFLRYVFLGILDGTIFAIFKDINYIKKQNMKVLHI
jgi:GT2 family glycosyltransferase